MNKLALLRCSFIVCQCRLTDGDTTKGHRSGAESPFTGPSLCRLQAHEVVRLLKKREVSPCEVLSAALAPIEQVEPLVNATTGLPALALPIWFTNGGIPVGLQPIGPPRGEAKLLGVASIIDQACSSAARCRSTHGDQINQDLRLRERAFFCRIPPTAHPLGRPRDDPGTTQLRLRCLFWVVHWRTGRACGAKMQDVQLSPV
jgi:hypothetical protein